MINDPDFERFLDDVAGDPTHPLNREASAERALTDAPAEIRRALECVATCLRHSPAGIVASPLIPDEGKAYMMRTSKGSFVLLHPDQLKRMAEHVAPDDPRRLFSSTMFGVPVLASLPEDAMPIGIFDGCP